MSIGSVIVTPTPTAAPFTAAITGFFDSKIRRDTRPPPSRGIPSLAGRLAATAAAERLAPAGEIGTGAEAPTPAGDDDRPYRVVGVGAIERVDHLGHHRARERVEHLRPVEREGGDAVADVQFDLRVVHERKLTGISRGDTKFSGS